MGGYQDGRPRYTKGAYVVHEALAEVKNAAGTQFCPRCVVTQ